MNDYTIEYLKNKLENYRYILNQSQNIENQMLEIETRRLPHAPTFDRVAVQGSSDPLNKELNKIEMTEKLFSLYKEKELLDKQMNEIKEIIECLDSDIQSAVFKIHCLKCSTYEKESRRLFMSEITLKRFVNRELLKIDTRYTLN